MPSRWRLCASRAFDSARHTHIQHAQRARRDKPTLPLQFFHFISGTGLRYFASSTLLSICRNADDFELLAGMVNFYIFAISRAGRARHTSRYLHHPRPPKRKGAIRILLTLVSEKEAREFGIILMLLPCLISYMRRHRLARFGAGDS